jgi:adenine-specific DNA-methyltransferase
VSAIDDLIAQIEDRVLRERLKIETDRIAKEKKFGLVFEEHLPELTPLYNAEIRVGSRVARRCGDLSGLWRVLSVSAGQAICMNYRSGERKEFSIHEIMAVANFGEPIFPTLVPVDKVQNGPSDAPWHTLIEADNYHALQLLEYLYTGQVDCIYIDPPYNTGARDWKYNNDYVDANDSWRHSKWLAFMQRRLRIARRLLKDDGVLITTVDDNEFAHLWMMLRELFPSFEHVPVTIQHNPGGTQGDRFSVTHEYAVFSMAGSANIFRKPHVEGDTYNLRRWGSTSGRFEGATCFYPIIVDAEGNVIEFGAIPDDHFSPSNQTIQRSDGTFEVWPIDKNKIEKKWRYALGTVGTVKSRMFTIRSKDRIEIKLRREDEQPKTVWTDRLYNAEAHGTSLLKQLMRGGFSYPKSIYAVKDAISCAVKGKKNALTLDFFAGSGTTLNAVNLLNAEDGGRRCCIMVTNNEVAEEEAKTLRAKGLMPGDDEWEKHGICQAITWPRSKYTILGYRDDGTEIEGEYFTGKFVEKEKPRNFYHIDFASSKIFNTAARKKRFVRIIEGIPQSLVRSDSAFILSDDEKHFASVLFDDTQVGAWLDALTDHEHITDFYIVTERPADFNKIKDQVTDLLGPMTVTEEEKRPIKDGFEANLEYFQLEFLDKDRVALGRQFREILPLLWLCSGAIGQRPELPDDGSVPAMLISKDNSFAVLVDETCFADFLEALNGQDGITHVYLVTDAEEAFQEMASQIKVPHVIQLYRDYIENFVINREGGR